MSRSGRRRASRSCRSPATVAKLLAMHRSGQMEVDLIDTGDDTLLQLDIAGALMPIDYRAFKLTNPEDLDPAIKRKEQVGNFVYAMIMGYPHERLSEGQGAEVLGRVLGHQGVPRAAHACRTWRLDRQTSNSP